MVLRVLHLRWMRLAAGGNLAQGPDARALPRLRAEGALLLLLGLILSTQAGQLHVAAGRFSLMSSGYKGSCANLIFNMLYLIYTTPILF